MRFIIRLIIFLLPLTLMGCGYFSGPSIVQGRDKAYLKASSIPPTRILPGMKTSAFHNHYPIPDRAYPNIDKTVTIVPPGLN